MFCCPHRYRKISETQSNNKDKNTKFHRFKEIDKYPHVISKK